MNILLVLQMYTMLGFFVYFRLHLEVNVFLSLSLCPYIYMRVWLSAWFSLSLCAASVELFILVLQSLYVNLLKSNIVVFRNGGQRKQWYYDSKEV